MSKITSAIFFVLIFTLAVTYAAMAEEGLENRDGRDFRLGNSGKTIVRGIGNAGGILTEFVSTARREQDAHSRLWPLTYGPRMFTNFFYRAASAINDIFFYPWSAPYLEDPGPITRPMGLPDYPWQKELKVT